MFFSTTSNEIYMCTWATQYLKHTMALSESSSINMLPKHMKSLSDTTVHAYLYIFWNKGYIACENNVQ